jgi:hypothetical protein
MGFFSVPTETERDVLFGVWVFLFVFHFFWCVWYWQRRTHDLIHFRFPYTCLLLVALLWSTVLPSYLVRLWCMY